jgi:hypothetical protein
MKSFTRVIRVRAWQAQKAAAALMLATCANAVAQLTGSYSYQDLGVPATFQQSYAFGINNLGQVVGSCSKPPDGFGFSNHVPYVYTPGVGLQFISVPGNTGGTGYAAYEINDNGTVVGGGPTRSGIAFYSDMLANVTKVYPLAANQTATFMGINASGTFTGSGIAPVVFQYRAFSYAGGAAVNLGVPAGFTSSHGQAINASGMIVGLASNPNVAFSVSGGVMTSLHSEIAQIQTGITTSAAYDVNDSGWIVGHYSISSGFTRPFKYKAGVGASLLVPAYGGSATAVSINNSDQVVLSASPSGGLFYDPTLGHSTLPLLVQGNTGGATINVLSPNFDGKVINDWGQVVANASVGAFTHAALLSPLNPFTASTNGGAGKNAKIVGGMGYDKFTPLTNPTPGSLGSTVSMPGGTASTNKNVQVTFQPGGNFSVSKASDIVDLTGTGTDLFVLQLSYDEAQANALFGGEVNAFLSWYDIGNVPAAWKNAVLGNSNAGAIGLTRNQGARAFNIAIDLELGRYGVDTAANCVWAVLDHNSAFGVIKASGFSSWAATYPGIGALDDDDDLDGWINLAEYALGTNPTHGSNSGPGIALNGITPRFTVNKGTMAGADPNIQYQVQFSPDLSDWTTQAPTIIQSNATTVVAEPPSPTAKGFFRLVITSTP